MKWVAFLLALLVAMAGCAGDDGDSGDSSTSSTDSSSTSNTEPQNENPPVIVDFSSSVTTGEVPFDAVIYANATDVDSTDLFWNLDLDGDGESDELGKGFPINLPVTFTQAGTFDITLDVTDLDFSTSATVTIEASAYEPLEPIQITGTTTGAQLVEELSVVFASNFHEVEIPRQAFSMNVVLTPGPTALDLDLASQKPSGGAGPGSGNAPPAGESITVNNPEIGTWVLEVIPYTSVLGDYTIDITFT